MKLFAKGKGGPGAPTAAQTQFQPIDRFGLLGLLDQVVNSGGSGTLQLMEPRGSWTYGFQGGALSHASGGRIRGARQAFDLLWEFQSGQFLFVPGPNPELHSNLYIDKSRLLDLLRRSQTVLQGPASPYIPPDQQRPVAPVNPPFVPQPGTTPAGWQAPPQGRPMPVQPGWQPVPPAAPGYPAAYPNVPYQPGPGAGMPPQRMPGPMPPQPLPPQPMPQYPMSRQPLPPQPMAPRPMQPMPGQPAFMNPQVAPPAPMPMPPAAPAAPARPTTPPSFSVPPMPIPRRKEAAPAYQPPVAAGPAPAPPAAEPKTPAPEDDLKSLRASLVAQTPAAGVPPTAPTWGVRKPDGTVMAPPPAGQKAQSNGKQRNKRSRLSEGVRIQLIKFLLWACERKYSPDDHWTLNDAFEVSTMELRDQFVGAFSQSFKNNRTASAEDDDLDQVGEGRMRGRARARKR